MRVLFLFLTFSLFWSCQNDSASKTTDVTNESTIKTNEPTTEIKEPEETVLTNNYCFATSSKGNINTQDKTTVKLTIIGKEVTGSYNWMPAGKDSARGTLTGTISKNKVITAVYDYVIEGSNQKEEKIFKMEVNQLLVKKGELEEVGGVLKLKNPEAAKFSQAIPRVICR